MAVLDPSRDTLPFPHSGTFSANPISMTAGLVAMELFDQNAVSRLNRLGDLARTKISDAIVSAEIPACVTGAGSMFRVHLKPDPPANYRSTYQDQREVGLIRALCDYLHDHGFMMINTCSGALSTAMTEAEIERLATTMQDAFGSIKDQFVAGQ